jgi:hypothetical protein
MVLSTTAKRPKLGTALSTPLGACGPQYQTSMTLTQKNNTTGTERQSLLPYTAAGLAAGFFLIFAGATKLGLCSTAR